MFMPVVMAAGALAVMMVVLVPVVVVAAGAFAIMVVVLMPVVVVAAGAFAVMVVMMRMIFFILAVMVVNPCIYIGMFCAMVVMMLCSTLHRNSYGSACLLVCHKLASLYRIIYEQLFICSCIHIRSGKRICQYGLPEKDAQKKKPLISGFLHGFIRQLGEHDHTLDRTTNGSGPVREHTLCQVQALDAGSWKGPEFAGERVPTLREFLDCFGADPDMLFNIELKDYPADSGEFALESARRTIAMLDGFGVTDRCVLNSWSGALNEWLADTYGPRVRIHGYSPQERMGPGQRRFVYDYAYCVCLFGSRQEPVAEPGRFDFCKACGVEPWVYYSVDTPELYDAALARGAMLFTSNDPAWAMSYLRGKGLHG